MRSEARPSDFAIRAHGVSKRYLLDPKRGLRLRDVAANPRMLLGGFQNREPFWALRDVTLEVPHGQILGIIGPNGSGKSTLLRVLVGISQPTTGSITIVGRYGALLELGAGFHPNATGRENAIVNALFMGLSKREIKERLPQIIEFSGLGQFIDQPMRTYSSGMFLRLGFSVAIHVQPDILLVDEVLAVGDAEFQEKCFDHFQELKRRGTTIVVVTHNVEQLIEFADRVIMMEKGELKADGDPTDIVGEYINVMRRQSPVLQRMIDRAIIAGMQRHGGLDGGASRNE